MAGLTQQIAKQQAQLATFIQRLIDINLKHRKSSLKNQAALFLWISCRKGENVTLFMDLKIQKQIGNFKEI